MGAIAEWSNVDRATFEREIAGAYRPAVLRGLVASWPAVAHPGEAIADYLRGFDNGTPVDAIRTPPSARGRIFYNDNMTGFNFTRERMPVYAVLRQLGKYARFEAPPSMAVQSAPIAECLPGFVDENRMPLLDASVAPRIWLGNAVTTPAHFDESHNVACVVTGRRRFTLFPPEQLANLYIGPLDYAPTGTPISMVAFREPDFERFPRFREALEAALVAELEPGDAIFIPALWWHHVESLGKVNMLVNYWWREAIGPSDKSTSALNALLHCLVDLRHLPPDQRAAWGRIFAHYVFSGDEVAAHIPEHRRGVLGKMTPDFARQVRAFLASQLK